MAAIKYIISLITTYETEVMLVVIAIIGLFLFVKRHLWLLLFFGIYVFVFYIERIAQIDQIAQLAIFVGKLQQLFG